MEYEVNTIPFGQLPLRAGGVMEPLCNTCASPDCTNPIREQTVSVVGKSVKYRLYVFNNIVRAVVACKGYVGDQDVPMAIGPRPF
jgi:hypothetical protein